MIHSNNAVKLSVEKNIPKKKPPIYSVEFLLEGIGAIHQFKVRNTNSTYQCIIVREDSRILYHIRVGDVYNLKFNSENSPHLSEYLKAAIRFIKKQETGRFKGHFLVGFEILWCKPNHAFLECSLP